MSGGCGCGGSGRRELAKQAQERREAQGGQREATGSPMDQAGYYWQGPQRTEKAKA